MLKGPLMARPNILLICGGGGTEHEVSLISARYLQDKLASLNLYDVHFVEIGKDQVRRDSQGRPCELRRAGELVTADKTIKLDFAIPCIHGPPGETGQIQAVFELMELPFLGSGSEGSIFAFNKAATKLWLESLDVPVTPWVYLYDQDDENLRKAEDFFAKHGDIFIKATNQGSSVGCYHVTDKTELKETIKKAFALAPYVLIEKTIEGRELEVSVYEWEGKLVASLPGEIICPSKFYTYEEKYSQTSATQTLPIAGGLSKAVTEEIRTFALRAFRGLKLKHLARADFFLSTEGEVYLNEINTFPGHTPISMFPMMMENNGHHYEEFLKNIITRALTKA
jgi:D-alanine-D-alanine ligase